MKSTIVILSVITIGIFIVVANASSTIIKANTRIVNGTVVTNRTQFAYQVSLRLKSLNFHFCAGTIIRERVILTAAHCFETYTASIVEAVAGDLDTSVSSNDTIIKDLDTVVRHADYNSTSYENDVAIATTTTSFTWSSTVNYLPLANVTPAGGTECYVSGWGTIYYNGPTSSSLLYAMVPIINKTVCTSANVYGSRVTDTMVCAGYLEGTADACSGDSGGPLECEGFVAGTVSWGYGCAYAPYPGVYTNVAYFKTWIETQLGDYSTDNSLSTKHYSQIHVTLFLILFVMLVK